MIVIDGSSGEGGGQILRSALALSILTRTPFRMERIRAGRDEPGLLRQHLTAVMAAREVSNADVTGAELGSRDLTFRPRTVQGGSRSFSIGSAGSTTLVLQTVLPALLRAPASSTITIEGGTHNPAAPPFEFLTRAFLPLLARMGAKVDLALDQPGFFPRGGGRITCTVSPADLGVFELEERGALERRRAFSIVSALPPAVAERQLRIARDRLGLARDEVEKLEYPEERGPGNAVLVVYEFEHVTSVFAGLGDRSARAEEVA